MGELQPLRVDHAEPLLDFELANRVYFAAFISDRGDGYFQHFGERLDALLAEQASGVGAYYVLVDDDGSVTGRFNLTFTDKDSARLGYRVAEKVAGRGVATAAVEEICRLAFERHGVRTIRAATAETNVASQRVLLKAGFVRIGSADPQDVGGKAGSWYERSLPDGMARSPRPGG
jgi:RimJ/RimL family protein N-acetyltransferase